MAPALTVTIPHAQTEPLPKPYTTYTLSIALPLTTYALQKRYSDFTALDAALRAASPTNPPPTPLPPKHYLQTTINNPTLTDQRRRGLESYLAALLAASDPTPPLRAFLRLPATVGAAPARRAPDDLADPAAWLERHRETKAQLRAVRERLAARDAADDTAGGRGAGSEARAGLAEARAALRGLEEAVGGLAVGEGEKRRRRDLCRGLASEVEGLQEAVEAGRGTEAAAAAGTKGALLGERAGAGAGRRVLGGAARETEATRALDNAGVVQLQRQVMEEQDADVKDLTRVVQRMREMGVQINEELVLQNQMLGMVDEDVERLQGKVDVAKRRIGKLK